MSNARADWLVEHAIDILDAVVDCIVTIDQDGLIQSANSATLRRFGFDENELLGQPLTVLMPEPYRSEHQGYVRQFLRTREEKIIGIGRELAAQTSDGEIFPIYLAVSEISTDSGTYFAGIMRDLTEQKRAEADLLEQRDKLSQIARLTTMGEMTASIAHEINQPLTAISMYAQACSKLLASPNADEGKVQGALEKLTAQALRAGSIIERIQRFVRHEDGERAPVDLHDLLRELRHLATSDTRLHGIELSYDLGPESVMVLIDAVQIQQVALNLIRNAIDAINEVDARWGNTVTIQTRREGAMVEVAVVDSGVGVTPENRDLVFTAFHTTKKDGMGMGLSICRSIVEDHDGALDFRNNEAHGCTFYFQLPVLSDE